MKQCLIWHSNENICLCIKTKRTHLLKIKSCGQVQEDKKIAYHYENLVSCVSYNHCEMSIYFL